MFLDVDSDVVFTVVLKKIVLILKGKTMKVPYIGVTDFASRAQVMQALGYMPERINRRLHVGAMMNYKTLHGIPTEKGWENIWLNEAGLRGLFQPHPRVFNVLHYADYDDPCLTTSDDLIAACVKAGPGLQGLQLDMIWPTPQLIREVKQVFPHLEVILQVGKKALEQFDLLPSKYFVHMLGKYLPETSYFLIDCSLGTGKEMDVPYVLRYLRDANEIISFDGLAVGGGLGPTTYSLLEEIFNLSLLISCDAQGKMRSSGLATDPIEMDRVCSYIRRVSSLL